MAESRQLTMSAVNLHLQGMEVGVASLKRLHVHLDEIVAYAALLRRGEELLPVDRTLSDRHFFLGSRRPVLEMHREKAPWIFHKKSNRVQAETENINLELTLD